MQREPAKIGLTRYFAFAAEGGSAVFCHFQRANSLGTISKRRAGSALGKGNAEFGSEHLLYSQMHPPVD